MTFSAQFRALLRLQAPTGCLQTETFGSSLCKRSYLAKSFRPRQTRARSSFAASADLPDYVAPFFAFWPSYLAENEQKLLLTAALQRLDSMDSVKMRRRRAKYRSSPEEEDIQAIFAPDGMYDFHEGHFDNVIHHYREMHLTSWPTDQYPALPAVLQRLYALCPSSDTQTHLLHLASHGEILPHVDNISASGSWILGVSLGDERTLRMEGVSDKRQKFELSLPSGSVYLQKDQLRYTFEHSISSRAIPRPTGNQRLSIMIRDRPQQQPLTP